MLKKLIIGSFGHAEPLFALQLEMFSYLNFRTNKGVAFSVSSTSQAAQLLLEFATTLLKW
jgi:hypothetical protein